MMAITLAFDVYGTLINTQGVLTQLEGWLGESVAAAVSQTWRDKQLEYSFRRGLMRNYVDFSICTENALDYSLQFHHVGLERDNKRSLLEAYTYLPTFEDVKPALTELQQAGFRLFAFSNGSAKAVDVLLKKAGIRTFFSGIVSCEDLQSFKPNPDVYAHFLRESASELDKTWLISSNPFDVTGSISAGFKSAWVKRREDGIFDPWNIQPTAVITSLSKLLKIF
jgi:2-haloacid dehalogenase